VGVVMKVNEGQVCCELLGLGLQAISRGIWNKLMDLHSEAYFSAVSSEHLAVRVRVRVTVRVTVRS